MSEYIVSARKYRPATFKTVVGQQTLTSTLKKAIDSQRLAQAYLFCGPRGVGKTSCARIFAKTINCLSPTPDGEACGQCESCRAIDNGNSFNITELDAASNNSVDDIRRIIEEVAIPPQVGNYRVFIIDEVHMLSTAAFNAFLKTLEEPPAYAVFILATTEKHKVIPTILSRCQIYDFKRITVTDIIHHLAYVAEDAGFRAENAALGVIARKADGAMRDALSIFDQVAASSAGNITYEHTIANLNILDYDYYFRLVESFKAGNVTDALLIFNDVKNKGFDIQFFINGLASHVRDLMVAAEPRTARLLEVGEDLVAKYTAQATSLPLEWFYAAMKLLNEADLNYKTVSNKQLHAELLLIRLCQLFNPPTPPFDRVDRKDAPIDAPVAVAPSGNAAAPAAPAAPSGNAGAPAPSKPAAVIPDKKVTTPEPPAQPSGSKEVPPQETSPAADQEPLKAENKPKTRRKRAGGATRLTDLEAQVDVKQEEKNKREPVDENEFNAAWNEYIEANDDKPILTAAMKASSPSKVGEEEFDVLVVHPAQLQAFEANKLKLVQFLRTKLENDFISLKVAIDQNIKVTKPLPNKELFKDILEKNEVLANFINNIDPELI